MKSESQANPSFFNQVFFLLVVTSLLLRVNRSEDSSLYPGSQRAPDSVAMTRDRLICWPEDAKAASGESGPAAWSESCWVSPVWALANQHRGMAFMIFVGGCASAWPGPAEYGSSQSLRLGLARSWGSGQPGWRGCRRVGLVRAPAAPDLTLLNGLGVALIHTHALLRTTRLVDSNQMRPLRRE
jgi:hypothetical protein